MAHPDQRPALAILPDRPATEVDPKEGQMGDVARLTEDDLAELQMRNRVADDLDARMKRKMSELGLLEVNRVIVETERWEFVKRCIERLGLDTSHHNYRVDNETGDVEIVEDEEEAGDKGKDEEGEE